MTKLSKKKERRKTQLGKWTDQAMIRQIETAHFCLCVVVEWNSQRYGISWNLNYCWILILGFPIKNSVYVLFPGNLKTQLYIQNQLLDGVIRNQNIIRNKNVEKIIRQRKQCISIEHFKCLILSNLTLDCSFLKEFSTKNKQKTA